MGFQDRGFNWAHVALFSAMVASTDALSVTAILKKSEGGGGPGEQGTGALDSWLAGAEDRTGWRALVARPTSTTTAPDPAGTATRPSRPPSHPAAPARPRLAQPAARSGW